MEHHRHNLWAQVNWCQMDPIRNGTERSPSPDPLLMMTSRIVLYWLRGCCLHNQWPARKSVHIPIYPLQGSLQSSLCGCLSSLQREIFLGVSPIGIRINGFYRRCTNPRLGWKTKQCTSLTMKVVSIDVVHLERYSHTFPEVLSLSVSQVPTHSALHPLIIRWSRILRVEWSN